MSRVDDADTVMVVDDVDGHNAARDLAGNDALDTVNADELDGERSLRERAAEDAAFGEPDLHMHDVARYGISGFTGLGLAWGTLAVVVATIGAPVGAAPSLMLLVVWLTVWIGSAALVNAALGRVQRRSLGAPQKQLSSSSSSTGGTSIAVPGMRP